MTIFLYGLSEARRCDWAPNVDVYRAPGGWVLKFDLAGVRPGDFTPDETLARLIRRYTREAGVRQLERNIGRLYRKVAVRFAEGKGEMPIGNHRMRPGPLSGSIRQPQPAFFSIFSRRGLDETNRAVLAQHHEVTVGLDERALSHAPIFPDDLPVGES